MKRDPASILDDMIADRGGAAAVAAAEHPLDDVEAYVGRFCVFRDVHALVAVTLWAAHAHMVEKFHTSPRLLLSSPEAGSGKTRVLEVLDLLVPEPLFCLNAKPAAIFRTLATRQITLLVDEVDAIFSRRGAEGDNEDLRAMLNAGYKRGASIPRCVGPRHDVQQFEVFCATAMAGLGDVPETIMSRSVIIRMRKRAAHERAEPFRSREQEGPGHALRARLARWALKVADSCGCAWPTMPDGIVDRPAEAWEPLIAVADAAGGDWPTRARAACVALCEVAADRRATLGVRLLSDLRIIFGDADALHTKTILERLHNGEGLEADAPWGDLHGKPIAERAMATMLKKYDVASVKVKVGGLALQGYRRDHLWDAWQRYLPSAPTSKHPEPVEPPEPGELSARGSPAQVPQVPQVPLPMQGVRFAPPDIGDPDHPDFIGPPDLRRKARELIQRVAQIERWPAVDFQRWLDDAKNDPVAVLDVLGERAC